ncbi:hypothetical protein Kim5_PD00174 (plasmid) [Rhizobium sp. Kim5]|nr:hypothetical protein Kim5_PD00174 [Rhizobium sp. Kim5]
MQFAPINWRNQAQNSRCENRRPRPKYTVAQLPIFIATAEWPEPALCADCMGLFQYAGQNPARSSLIRNRLLLCESSPTPTSMALRRKRMAHQVIIPSETAINEVVKKPTVQHVEPQELLNLTDVVVRTQYRAIAARHDQIRAGYLRCRDNYSGDVFGLLHARTSISSARKSTVGTVVDCLGTGPSGFAGRMEQVR